MKNSNLTYKLFLICLILASFANSLVAQVENKNLPQLSLKIDTNEMLIGDHKEVEMKFEGKSSLKVQWPNLNTWSPKITLVEPSLVDTIINEDKTIYQQNFKITSFDTGFIALPPISIVYADSSKIDTIETDPSLIQVKSIPLDTSITFKDIKSIKTEPYTLKEFLPYILIGLAVVIVLIILIYIIDRLRKNKPIIPSKSKPLLPSHIEAYQALEKLDKKKLWQSGEVKLYYTILTNILRRYISRRYDIHALEKTSSEIIDDINKIDIETSLNSKLKDLFETSDFVKFAKLTPASEKYSLHFKTVENFIDTTKQIETEQENETEK